MAHVGMRPQSVRKYGRMSAVQRDEQQLLADALAAEHAGAFSIVLELVPAEIARTITDRLKIPTIGIGAGPHCDGQVLVTPDMFGLSGFQPKFVKQFADLRTTAVDGLKRYAEEVRNGSFPQASIAIDQESFVGEIKMPGPSHGSGQQPRIDVSAVELIRCRKTDH